MNAGTLYLVPAPLDFGCDSKASLLHSIPDTTLRTAAQLTYWVCENAKTTRAYLKRIGEIYPLGTPLQNQSVMELPRQVHKHGDHTGKFDARHLLQPARSGFDIGLVSEAGMPAVADPGSSVVRAAHELQIPVVPLVGPVSLMLALAASGLNGQHFAFVGYVPTDVVQRAQRLRALESVALATGQTQILIETPYRNTALLTSLLDTLQPGTKLAVACGLTLPGTFTRSGDIACWRRNAWVLKNDVPAVFSIGK